MTNHILAVVHQHYDYRPYFVAILVVIPGLIVALTAWITKKVNTSAATTNAKVDQAVSLAVSHGPQLQAIQHQLDQIDGGASPGGIAS